MDAEFIRRLEAENKALNRALASCVAAMKEVQNHWGDPSSWMHNRLETPMLVHAETIYLANAATKPHYVKAR